MTLKYVKLENIVILLYIYNICASFSGLHFISPRFAKILKYFAQSCDCMIAAFRNFVFGIQLAIFKTPKLINNVTIIAPMFVFIRL